MVRESSSTMNNEPTTAPLSLLYDIATAIQAGINMIKILVNQIIAEGIITVECELSTKVKCYKDLGDALKRGNYRRLELTDQILKIIESYQEANKVTVGVDSVWCNGKN